MGCRILISTTIRASNEVSALRVLRHICSAVQFFSAPTVFVVMTNGRGRVIVTGASTGIGEATARHLRDLGFSVLAGVRRDEDAERLRDQGLTQG
jgi:NADPH:quinone reductase-like Zn-dependent oxidoreductase